MTISVVNQPIHFFSDISVVLPDITRIEVVNLIEISLYKVALEVSLYKNTVLKAYGCEDVLIHCYPVICNTGFTMGIADNCAWQPRVVCHWKHKTIGT